MSTPLNTLIALHDYKKRFHQLHAALKNGLLAGIELGRELNRFIPSGLWKQEADTEVEFFQKNFPDWTPGYIRKLRGAASYTDALRLIADTTGETVKIPETVSEAIDQKSKEKAKSVSRVRLGIAQNTPIENHKQTSSTPKYYDRTGREVHHSIVDIWLGRARVDAVLELISRAKCALEEGRAAEDPNITNIHQDVIESLKALYHKVSQSKLDYICYLCQGKVRFLEGECEPCGSTGLISRDFWERYVTEKDKKLCEMGGRDTQAKLPK